MYAIVLAGGAGTRLRPLTYVRRKELLPLLNRPLLEYRLRNLAEHGVRDIVLACSEGMHEVEHLFGDAAFGARLSYTYEHRPLGSGRAVKEAARAAGASGSVVVCYGDILTNVDMTAMLRRHRNAGAAMTISLAAVDEPWQFGVVEADSELRISRFVEKPAVGEEPGRLINAGTWICEPDVLARIPDDDHAVRDHFAERVLLPQVLESGLCVQGFMEDLWEDVGSPERYLHATRLLLERDGAPNGSASGASIDTRATLTGRVLAGARTRVGARARLDGPVVVGAQTLVADDAVVRDSVLWDRVRVGRAARIERSIVADDVEIGADAVIVDSVVASGAVVGEGAKLEAGSHIMPRTVVSLEG